MNYNPKYLRCAFFWVKIHTLSSIILQLEEFRRKKAAEQAKKAASTSQNHASDVRPNERQPLETVPVLITDSEGVGTSDIQGQAFIGLSPAVTVSENKEIIFPIKNEKDSSDDAPSTPQLSVKNYDAYSADNKNFKRYGSSGFAGSMDVNHIHGTEGHNIDFRIYAGVHGGLPYETTADWSILSRTQASQDFDSTSSKSSFHGTDEIQPTESGNSLMQSSVKNPGYSIVSTTKVSPQDSDGIRLQDYSSNASMLIGAHTSSAFYDGNLHI